MKKHLLFMVVCLSYFLGQAQEYNYLGGYTQDGTPTYFDGRDVVPQTTLDMIANALPEGFPVPDYNPQYISSGYDTDIILDENADVWVTFVGEGAGYRNVLGFYTYDVNEPRTSPPNPADITIIFPNVSAKYSGGSLEVGDKVKIGRFDAGTGIGWVLLANGWNGNQVTPGLWQLHSQTSFNPEAQETLRHHNVLLSDPDNEQIILGFEDIRRDYASCDNDFNDALFYITANPYTAIKTTNYNKITDYTPVSSGNDGGLESHGDLAKLIAKRNFERSKNNTFKNTQKSQKRFRRSKYKASEGKSGQLHRYFPETGMFGTETTYVSSPDDLLAITNAEQVFAIDYYEGTERVSAALATSTKNGVYNHTKTICDRLNGSQLVDVRSVKLQGHTLLYSQLRRANGSFEYALTFSVKESSDGKTVYSFWNLHEYPEGDYQNFQVWGSSMGQVSTIANRIFDQLASEGTLKTHGDNAALPAVFIKSGRYQQGKLHIDLVNKSGALNALLDANLKTTEQQESVPFQKTVALSGAPEEEVVITTGNLFDIGLQIGIPDHSQNDALYLADGPWGLDKNKSAGEPVSFEITEQPPLQYEANVYPIERGVIAHGEVKETINVFRNLLGGDQSLATEPYSHLQFSIENDQAVEVSLLTDRTETWDERLRYTIKAHNSLEIQSIAFSDFKNAQGQYLDFAELKTIVFSVQGDYDSYTPFELTLDGLALTDRSSATDEEPKQWEPLEPDTEISETADSSKPVTEIKRPTNYPNPFSSYTTIRFPEAAKEVTLVLTNTNGQVVHRDRLRTNGDGHSVRLNVPNLPSGPYLYRITLPDSNATYMGKILKH